MNELMQLEQEFERINAPVLKYFNPGLSEGEIKEMFSQVGLIPPDELIELYKWRNGVRYREMPTGKLCFGVNGVFYPLQDSVEIYNNSVAGDFPFYYPIFSDDTFLINLDNESPDYRKIFIYCPALLINEPQACYDSLSLMIQTFVTCFQKRIFSYDHDELFQEHYELTVEVCKGFNPMSVYWRESETE
jgi:hypothetical protein